MVSNLNSINKSKCIYLISKEYCKLKTLQNKYKYYHSSLTENECILNCCNYIICNDLTTKFNIIKRIKNYFKIRRK